MLSRAVTLPFIAFDMCIPRSRKAGTSKSCVIVRRLLGTDGHWCMTCHRPGALAQPGISAQAGVTHYDQTQESCAIAGSCDDGLLPVQASEHTLVHD